MKGQYHILLIFSFIIAIIFGIFGTINSVKTSSLERNMITISYDTHIRYGLYYASSKEAYTYNIVEWNFNTNNESEITVLWMDYLNYIKFDVNDSTADYEILSVGKKKDNGVIKIPYNDRWVLLFLNLDSSFPETSISVETEVKLDPIFYFIIPLA